MAELAKTTIYAGVTGRLEQFTLRPGDLVNPIMRPAGILIPSEAGRIGLQAGFNQIEAQVIRQRHDRRGRVCFRPLQDHSAGRHRRAERDRRRPVAADRSAGRPDAGAAPRRDHRLSRAALPRRHHRPPPGKQLHGQRLHQQPRKAAVARRRHAGGHRLAHDRRGRRGARGHPAAPGDPFAGTDPRPRAATDQHAAWMRQWRPISQECEGPS